MGALTAPVPHVKVLASIGPHTAEDWAELAINRIIKVGDDNVPEPLRAQAVQYRDKIKAVIAHYIEQAKQSERAAIMRELELGNQ